MKERMSEQPEYRNVLVVGGGTGIGLGIARAFEKAGYQVAVAGRREEVLEAAVAGTGMRAHRCDVVDREQIATLLAWFEKVVGQVDILVFSAGINIPRRTWEDFDPASWDRVVEVNLTGAYNVMQAFLPGMRKRGDGLIFNVTSLAGSQSVDLAGVPYSAAKSGQNSLGVFANMEALPDGVRVTNVIPGETNTPILDDRPVPPPEEKRSRMVHPEDIAQMVLAVARLPRRAVVPELIVTPAHMPRL